MKRKTTDAVEILENMVGSDIKSKGRIAKALNLKLNVEFCKTN